MTQVWDELHKRYAKTDWIDQPSIFAQQALPYFPKTGKILELGGGQGQDGRYFAQHGYKVVESDVSKSALEIAKSKASPELAKLITVQEVDLRLELPFKDTEFDVIYAHLSLHYFDLETTKRLYGSMYRVLKPGGILAFLCNSISDPEFGTGTKLEDDYFQIDKTSKRYFSVQSTRKFTHFFEPLMIDSHGETFKDSAKGVHNLIRYIGQKPHEVQLNQFALPFVGAIVERQFGEHKQILMQTRWKPGSDPEYSGTLEFPAGVLDKPYEMVTQALAREIQEETGLKLKSVRGEQDFVSVSSNGNDQILGFQPYYCTQQLRGGKPWIGFVFVCEVESGEPKAQLSETKDVHWKNIHDVKRIVDNNPEQIFGLELPALLFYLENELDNDNVDV